MLILPSRRQVLTGLGAAGAIAAATASYAFDIEPLHRLVVTRYAPRPAAWPDALRLRVAVLADFHVCEPFMPLDRVAEIVATTNTLAPDLILLLGDYPAAGRIAWRKVPLTDFARVVSDLRAPLGTLAVLGNHDWWDDPAAQAAPRGRGVPEARRVLEAKGIPVLENAAVPLTWSGRRFWVAGLGDQEAYFRGGGADDLPGTLEKVTDDAPLLLMAHEPDIFPRVPERAALTLSGHTHGGQVRLFGVSPAIRAMRRHGYAYGHYVERGRHLVVSGGFGVSRVPVRFGVPPEIVLVELGGSLAVS